MAPLDFQVSLEKREERPYYYSPETTAGDESSVDTEVTVDGFRIEEKENWIPSSEFSMGVTLPVVSKLHRDKLCRSESSRSTSSISLASISTSHSFAVSPQPRARKVLPIKEGSKVSFYSRVKSKKIQSLDSLSEEEINATWYSPEEMLCIRQDAVNTIRIMTGDCPPAGANGAICFRGLEYKTGRTSQARKLRKLNTRDSVLEEQELHRQMNINDPETIALISREYSEPCMRAAIEAAERDHILAFEQWAVHYDEKQCLYSNDEPDTWSGCWRNDSSPIARTLAILGA
eukprot:scaffold2322_cov135-Cylindrotheca_fusiformis.AAC.5